MQEMGVSGSGSLEVGDSSGDIFWIKNSEFLKHFYKTYPIPVRVRCVRGGFGRCEIFLNNIGYSWKENRIFDGIFCVILVYYYTYSVLA